MLLFDLKATQPNISGKRHGGGRYGEIVFFKLVEQKREFICFYDSKSWINPEIENACKDNGIGLYDLNETSVESLIGKYNIRTVYSASANEIVSLKALNCRVIVTIHGLRDWEIPLDNTFWEYRNTFRQRCKFMLMKIFKKAYRKHIGKKFINSCLAPNIKIVTVSNHSKFSLNTFFPETKKMDIPVFYSPSTTSKYHISKSKTNAVYFLLVSGDRWGKNNLRVIKAFDELFSAGLLDMKSIKIKIAGSTGKNFSYKIKHPICFEFMGYVDDMDLEYLYANAYSFIYPSLNEGFGYPPIEAMHYGIPVLSSPFSSIPEVCGDAVIYFNPFSIDEIKNRILMILEPNIHNHYEELSKQRYDLITKKQNEDLDGLIKYLFNNEF